MKSVFSVTVTTLLFLVVATGVVGFTADKILQQRDLSGYQYQATSVSRCVPVPVVQPPSHGAPYIGDDAPDASVFTLYGEGVQLQDYFGEKPTVIIFGQET